MDRDHVKGFRGIEVDALRRKNRRVLLAVLSAVALMVMMAFAAVPLYDLFCRVTGYGGTTQISDGPSGAVIDRKIRVRFNADTHRDMPWRFSPDQTEISVLLGQDALVSYTAMNPTEIPVTGTAIYNVTPQKVGKYFHKTQCFCFDEQRLQPGQDMTMPVVFYIDPAMHKDAAMDDVTTITLSYTFFQAESQALDRALEVYYDQ